MGKFITKFGTAGEYTTAEATLAKPHVSLVEDGMVVHYLPKTN